MMAFMKRLLAIFLVLAALGSAPVSALADDSNAPKSFDGRLDDYNKPVTLDNGGTALTYFVWIILGAVAVIVLFKDSKRSHLD
jgi:hypothetical protein